MFKQKRGSRQLGDISALVRASRTVTTGNRPATDKSAAPKTSLQPPMDLTPPLNMPVEGTPPQGDAVTRKRRLVALFCKMLGEQLLEGNSPPAAQEPLSPRERQTLELLLAGNAEKEIASRLSISRHTVHVYVKSLYKRFGVNSRGELLARWVQR